jgi:hypothetical protein
MFQKIKNKIIHDKTVQVVGVQFGEATRYSVLQLDNLKNELFVASKFSNLSWEDLKSKLNKKHPLILVFSGKGVLNKKVKRTPDYKSKVLLSVNVNEFYFYEFQQKNDVFLSVARKSSIDEQIQFFDSEKFLVVDYSIGVFSSVVLKGFIDKEHYASNDFSLKFKAGDLDSFSKDQVDVSEDIDGQKITAAEMPLFATGLNFYYPSSQLVYDTSFLEENKQEKNFKRYFEILGGIMLGGFFLLLLLSYSLLGYYNEKTVESNVSLGMLKDTYSKVKVLEKERDDKKAVLNESGVFTESFLSYYINELSTDLPKTIQLSEFLLFPNTKKIKQSEKVLFEANTIVIKGMSSSNLNFNKWYKGLKKVTWVKKTDIVTYNKNRQNHYDFELRMIIR